MTDTAPIIWSGEIAPPRPNSMTAILTEVAERRRVKVKDLAGPDRCQSISRVRQEAMWEIQTRTTLSLSQIGRRLGGRHHTTVLFGVRAHERRMAEGQG